jgi:hypothetical protein
MNLLDSQFQLTPFFGKKEGLNCKKIVKNELKQRLTQMIKIGA